MARTDAQIQAAVEAAAKLARQLTSNPMSTPQHRDLADKLHGGINNDLDELDRRKGN
ncbi:hypothetical protein ACFWRZ_08360 [Streptomyces rubiginosohelvolus]|uniref:hypothetical protein n=1 Tax=Streptomyces rubiginosohelvolus TaxID=67362 RepID=UPI003669A149